jgi:WD40 repeat protein
MAGRAQDIFENAVGLQGPAREAYLNSACGADAALRAEVSALLRIHDRAPRFLASPTADSAGAATIVAAPSEHEGQVIGRYKLLQPIGEGGFGSVWMAEQREPVKRLVAFKIIKLGMDTKQVIARFEAERQALAMMDHPNIAKVLDAGSMETGRPFFVMEYIKGVPILEYCDSERLDTNARLDLFTSVCHAIQHAHQKGIIHRDIKPGNVLITMHDGVPVPKVIDFGIAKATNAELTQKTLFTEHRQMIGTPAYMSPEQAEMSGLDIDTRSDVYSLGVLLYELLTGTTPFAAEELMSKGFAEMMRIIREVEPHKPSTRLSSLGETATKTAQQRHADVHKLSTILKGDLDWIVMKCLEKDRTRRYETANGLAMDVRRYLGGEAVFAAPPSASYRLKKFIRRNRGVVTAGGAVAAALLVGVIAFAWQAKVARDQRDLAEEAREAAQDAQAEAEAHQKRAEAEQHRAEAQLTRAEWLVYAGKLMLAQTDFELGNGGLTLHYLAECQEKLRGWEWRHLWARANAEMTLAGHLKAVSSVAVSPDGRRIVSGSEDGLVKVWDAATGQALLTFGGHTEFIMAVAFSPDGGRILTGGGQWGQGEHPGDLKVWEATSGRLLLDLRGHKYFVWSLAFSADGQRIVSGAGDWGSGPGEIKVWNAGTGQEDLTFTGNAGAGKCVAFSPDGQRIVGGSADVWDAATGQVVLRLQGHDGFVRDATFSPDGRRIAAGNLVWDGATGQELVVLKGHGGWVNSITFSPDGSRLATGSSDQTIKVWDAATGLETLTIKGHTGYVRDVVFSPDGQRIFAASNDHTVKVWDPIRGQEVPVLRGHREFISNIAFSPDGSRIVTGSGDGTVKVWDTRTWQEVLTLEHAKGAWEVAGVWSVAFSPDGNRIVTACADHTAKVWDAVTGETLLVLKHTQGVGAVAFSPDGQRIFTGTSDGAKVWDAATGRELLILKDANFTSSSVAFSPDGTRIVTACADQTARVWDAATGQELQVLRGHTHDLYGLTISPDGQRIATASADRTAKVWDAVTGGELLTLKGHTEAVRHVRFSPDGERIVTGSDDRSARIWNARTGQELLALRQHPSVLWGLAISPDGQRIVTGSGEIAKVWDAPPPPPQTVTPQAEAAGAAGTVQPE